MLLSPNITLTCSYPMLLNILSSHSSTAMELNALLSGLKCNKQNFLSGYITDEISDSGGNNSFLMSSSWKGEPSSASCFTQDVCNDVMHRGNFSEMCDFGKRLDTFPSNFAEPAVLQVLAYSGLLLYDKTGITQCFCCGKVQNNWSNGKSICDSSLHELDCHHFLNYKQKLTGDVYFHNLYSHPQPSTLPTACVQQPNTVHSPSKKENCPFKSMVAKFKSLWSNVGSCPGTMLPEVESTHPLNSPPPVAGMFPKRQQPVPMHPKTHPRAPDTATGSGMKPEDLFSDSSDENEELDLYSANSSNLSLGHFA